MTCTETYKEHIGKAEMKEVNILKPNEIEKTSFGIIEKELEKRGIVLPKEEAPVTKRVIHTTADFDYADTLTFSGHAVETAKELIMRGADIVTDTNMVLAGINKKVLAQFGGQAHCFMADKEVAEIAKKRQVTRAAVSMEFAARLKKPVIFAVGNAPTALIRLHEMMQDNLYRPAFIIGVPVGFVNVEAAKELILQTDIPYIVNRGRKGGSNVAAAICNAVLYDIEENVRVNGSAVSDIGAAQRFGFTTGSCAAAAAKAAAFMLLTGTEKTEVTVQTPKGIPYHAKIRDICRTEESVSCAVEKDGGSDPDVTTGSLVYAKVTVKEVREAGTAYRDREKVRVEIEGGEGIGRVTKPGLNQPIGNAAINAVPREMIRREVADVCALMDFCGVICVELSVPGGAELAKKTFNPRLGIEGGISILGTTGIVEPMSEKALLDTVMVELRQRKAMGETVLAVSPGNYGQEFMRGKYGYDLDKSVKCSNYIGAVIDMAAACGFEKMLLTGHIGKLIKVSGGVMNTHSREGDCRMELLGTAALSAGVGAEAVLRILGCVTTEEGLRILQETDKFADVMKRVMDKICFYLDKRAAGRIQVECMVYSNEYGELAASSGAREFLAWMTGQTIMR